ncbi:hypothetical protein BGZ98_003524, partial [Dissophora globulifera]
MIFSKTLSVVAVALAAIASMSVEASPIPARNDVATYVPVSERKYSAEVLEHHEKLMKRSSFGLNDWNCKPSASHPLPLILVHGLLANSWDNWLYMGPRFAAAGHCTYSFTYGSLPGIPLFAGLDKIENSAAEMATFVDQVLAATKATKANIVGHSQGTLMPRYYLKYLGGAAKI